MKYAASLTLVSALALGFASSAFAADAYLSGTVTSAAGEKMGGVTVSAKAAGSTITTSVYTGADGSYAFPALEPGQYRVWAQAVSFDAGKSELALKDKASQDFTLKPFQGDFFKQLTGEMVLASLPHETPDDKRIWQIIHNNCTGCHTPNYPLQNKFDAQGWNAIIDLMKMVNVGGIYQGPQHKPNVILQQHQKELVDYLTKARGPGESSMKLQVRPRPTGEAARVVVKEYDVPLDPDVFGPNKYTLNDGSDWSLGAPSNMIGARPHDVWPDLDGNLWFTQNAPSRGISIGRVDRVSGAVKHFKIDGQNNLAANTHGMTRDPDGIIWFNTGATIIPGQGGLARLDPKTEKIEVFVPPKPMSGTGGATTVDWAPGGTIWVTAPDGALRFDPKTKEFTPFKSLTEKLPNGVGTSYGMAADREGNGWWAQMAIDTIGKGHIPSKEALEVKLPQLASNKALVRPEDEKAYGALVSDFNTPLPWANGPRRMGADKAGDFVYICGSFSGNLTRINIQTLETKVIPLPNAEVQHPYHAAVDSQHNVWVNVMNSDQVLRYNPATEQWTSFDLPTHAGEARYVSLLEKDGKLQLVLPEYRGVKLAVVTFRSDADVAADKAAATR